MKQRTKLMLALIVVVYVALGAAFSVVVPLGESPDEVDHFLFVRSVVQNGRLPVMVPEAAANETMEANQPPLYYLAGALLARGVTDWEPLEWHENACFTFDPEDNGRAHFYEHTPVESFPYRGAVLAFHLVRLLSVAMGAVTVVLAFLLARQMTGSETSGLVAAGILAFNPQFVFINASVNNDVLTACLGAAIVLASLMLMQRPTPGRSVVAGLLVGLGLLTKFALLALWPLALLAALLPLLLPVVTRNVRRAQFVPRLRSAVSNFLIVLLMPLLLSGWWYVRNWRLYGDPLVWDVHLQAKGAQVLRTMPLTSVDFLAFVRIHFQSYWGWFGWLKIQLPEWAYWLVLGLVLVALTGLLWHVSRFWRLWRGGQLPLSIEALPWGLLLSLLAVAAIYTSLIRYIFTINWSGYQGRLAYAVAAPIAALLAFGWVTIGERVKRPFFSALFPLVGLCLTAGSLLWLVAPAYARPALYQPPQTAVRACWQLGDGLLLEAFDAPGQVQPGETLPVTVYGYGLYAGGPEEMRVELVGGNGTLVGAADVVWNWSAGEVVSQTLALPVAADARPARAVLQAGLLDAAGGWQAAATVAGTAVVAPTGLTTLKIAPLTPFAPSPEYEMAAQFGEQLALVGYDLTLEGIVLYWQAAAKMAQDYTTFVHVLDEAGQLIAQSDSQPTTGVYPTSIWDQGEVVADSKLVEWRGVDAVVLAVGVYDPETLVRLPVTLAGQPPPPENMLRLPLPDFESD